jgi:hypothetical protein
MSYNSVIHHEQGGSVLNINSTGSLNVALGGAFNMSGKVDIKSGACQVVSSGGSFIIENGGRFQFGPITVFWGTELPGTLTTSAGDWFVRSGGSVSSLFINRTVNNAGSVWKAASMLG